MAKMTSICFVVRVGGFFCDVSWKGAARVLAWGGWVVVITRKGSAMGNLDLRQSSRRHPSRDLST